MDELLWRRLLGQEDASGGGAWLAVTFLAGLFGVAVWRPQRIGKPALFRMAYILFALYLLLPAIGEIIVRMALLDPSQPRAVRPGDVGLGLARWVSPVLQLVGKIVFGISMVCSFGSLDFKQRE